MLNHQVTIIDFYDSFTYNIAADIYRMGLSVRVLPYDQLPLLHKKLKQSASGPDQRHLLIYGPGPGHPGEYQETFPLIRDLLEDHNVYHLGICLGHQILWEIRRGIGVRKSRMPLHGQSVRISIPEWSGIFSRKYWNKRILVQRYNSLTLDFDEIKQDEHLSDQEGMMFLKRECYMGFFERGLTYQFHPESVGTACNEVFFSPIGTFLRV